ncbi:MAG: prepilin-type N-terminal cleavage/methylation domain-containing protein [Planctomycetota bacterium]|nr:MAG: prepilin-type N-terminal cleavage/methylation domain-containing protein [Planctomycetota bacterium]
MKKRPSPTEKAFTLVEILVVITIIGILALMTVPAFQMFSKGQRLRNAGRLFQSAFDLAKRYAVNTRKSYHVLFLEDKLVIYGRDVRTLTGDKDDADPDADDAAGKGISPYKKEILLGKFVKYELGFRKDSYATEHAKTREEAIAALDKFALEFRPDGSINFEDFTDVPRDYIGSVKRGIEAKGADIYIRMKKGDKRCCFMDIDPASTRTRMNLAPDIR